MKTGWQGKGLGEVGKEDREGQGKLAEWGADARQAQALAPAFQPASEAGPGLPEAGLCGVWREGAGK